MTELMDYQIIQRGVDGYADVSFSGTYEKALKEGHKIVARVVREDDNLNVVFWTPCAYDGHTWSVDLRVPEGGLYRFEAAVQDNEYNFWIDKIKCVYHVGVGDIYIATGQSNMTGYGRDTAYDPPTLGVHAFRNNGRWDVATHPLADGLGGLFGDSQNATGTSPALSFARRLKDRLGVPIGIIPAAVGATSLSQWSPEGSGEWFKAMCARIEYIGAYKGYIWLQGCSDTTESNAPTYLERFKRMLELWAEKLGRHPMITVQLNRYAGESNLYQGMVCDAQRRAALEIDDVFVVPSLELGITDGIHNSSGANVVIGERMANAALAGIYGKPGQTAAAVVSAERIDDTHLLLHINPGHHVACNDDNADGMHVEDASGLMECVKIKPAKDGVIVETVKPYTLPAKFHYAWDGHPPVCPARDYYDMPLLACYGVEIEPDSHGKEA